MTKDDIFANNPISLIETAIIERIKQALNSGALPYQIPVVESYGGEVDENLPHLIKSRGRALWVTYAGEKASEDYKEAEADFVIIVYVRDNQAEKASRQRGANQMISDIKRLFIRQRLGLNITPLEFVEVVPLTNAVFEKYYTTVYAIRFRTIYREQANQESYDNLSEFLRVGSKWTVASQQSDLNFNVRSKKAL